MKTCFTCKKTKPFSEFYTKKDKRFPGKIYYRSKCKKCYYADLPAEKKLKVLKRVKNYYVKNQKKISQNKKKQRQDPNSSLNLYKFKGVNNWNNKVFNSLIIKWHTRNRELSLWTKRLDKLTYTNRIFELKRLNNKTKNQTVMQNFENWKIRQMKDASKKKMNEIGYLFEYFYTRTTKSLTNKIKNVTKNNWEIRFDSVPGMINLRK